MASGRARVLHEKTMTDVVICDRSGNPRWHPIWQGVPYVKKDRNGEQTVDMIDGPGARPYYKRNELGALAYILSHRAQPGTIAFNQDHERKARDFLEKTGPYVLIEPHVKGTNSADNKLWHWDRWKTLSFRLMAAGYTVAQIQYQERKLLPQAVIIRATDTFHEVAAHIKLSSLTVASEGGYHHAAAAVGAKAVVLWGGLTTPEFLGYPKHRNIFHDHPESPCGRYSPCKHCRECMDRITVDEVFEACMEELNHA